MSTISIDVVQDQGALTAVLPSDVIFSTKKEMTMAPMPDNFLNKGNTHARWGCDDMHPTKVRCKLEKVPMAMRAIDQLVKMMYGNGITYYRNSDLNDGDGKVKRAYIQEVEDFIWRSRIDRFLIAQMVDYRFYMNAFSELVFSRAKDKIAAIYHKPAEFCRLSLQNEETLHIDSLFYSPDFSLGRGLTTSDRWREIPLIRWYDEDNFLQSLAGYKFAYHSHYPTPGVTYYARAHWMGLAEENGWLDVAINVPRIVSAMQKNQILLKYQINIPETYFEVRDPDWHTYTSAQRNDVIKKKVAELNQFLTSTDNVYKSLASVFKEEQGTHQPYGKIEIIAIDDKTKKGTWVPDSNAADAQIVQGLGLHPSQVGLAPEGGKMGAGSGSDQRESFNTGITLNTLDQKIILEPLNWIARYNRWGITFMIDHTYHTTTNIQEDGLSPTSTTIQLEQ
jgi:hypothetical protein